MPTSEIKTSGLTKSYLTLLPLTVLSQPAAVVRQNRLPKVAGIGFIIYHQHSHTFQNLRVIQISAGFSGPFAFGLGGFVISYNGNLT
jgi:hypothetical protein